MLAILRKPVTALGATLFFLAGLLLASGCVSIIKGSSQTLSFNSEPEEAEVWIDGKAFGSTPLAVSLKKNKYSVVTFKKKGYRTQTVPIEKNYDGLALLNIFWDSSTTDLITGAAYEYAPSQYFAQLSPKEASWNKFQEFDFGKRGNIRRFVLLSYSNLGRDAANGDGEYFQALCELLGIVSPGAKQVFLHKLQIIFKENGGDEIKSAEQILQLQVSTS